MAAVMDEYAGEFSSSPGAVRMEYQLLGLDGGSGGVHPGCGERHTGFGRQHRHPDLCGDGPGSPWPESGGLLAQPLSITPGLLIIASPKSLHIAGLGGCVMRVVATDARFPHGSGRTGADDPGRPVLQDSIRGWWWVRPALRTWVIVDDLERISAVAHAPMGCGSMWMRPTAASLSCAIWFRDRFRGMELSDSVVMNPHKGLHTPFGLGAALVRDGEHLYRSHYYTADYLQDRAYHKQETLSRGRKPGVDPPFPCLAPVVAAQTDRCRPVPRHVERETAADQVCLQALAVGAWF